MTQFAFKRTGDSDYPRHLNILVMGPPKSGKTTFVSTAPNVIVAAVEAGLMSIAHLDVPYVTVDSTDKLQSLLLVLSDDVMRAKTAKQLNMPTVDTVAIDTLDAWQEILKKEILRENKRTVFQRDDWGTLKERMATILKAFVALPVNVIFTVHTDTNQDDEGRQIQTPLLQGGIKNDIAGYVDFSLMAFRQREVDDQGVPSIKYYLKNEGDLKNPHLGNRAAGRLPEISEPSFKVLHDAVFKGIKKKVVAPPPTDIAVESTNAVPPPETVEEAAPSVSQPTGVPQDEPDALISAAGITVLTKEYIAQGLEVPADLKEWSLAKGRMVAKYFNAWKGDKAVHGNAPLDDLIGYLQAVEAWAGQIDGLQTGVENLKTPPVTTDAAAVDEQGSPEATEEQAVAAVEEQLGGVVVRHEVDPDALCEECGNKIDDVDLAQLGLSKFKKVLCVADYKAEVKRRNDLVTA